MFGIDVMAVPYNFEQGYVKIRSGPVDVLIILMEDLNRSFGAGLADLYGLDPENIQMERSNVGGNKEYANLLAEVKDQLTIPPSVGDRVWGTDYARHFYGPDVDHLWDRWTENL